MKTRLDKIQISISFLLQLTLLAACTSGIFMNEYQEAEYPVLLDPRYSLKIYAVGSEEPVPFQRGDIVEINGLLIYHDVPEWVRNEVLAGAHWSATLYPIGAIDSAEEINLGLRGISRKAEYELIWGADNNNNLLVVSDRPVPIGLFLELQPGESQEVCVSLKVAEVDHHMEENERVVRIELEPFGEKVGSLIKSTLRECQISAMDLE